MTEDKLEQEMLTWLTEIGYNYVYGPTIACDGEAPERSNYQDILLIERLRRTINQLNPEIPPGAREDALQQVRDLNTPILLSANRRLHNFLVNGVDPPSKYRTPTLCSTLELKWCLIPQG